MILFNCLLNSLNDSSAGFLVSRCMSLCHILVNILEILVIGLELGYDNINDRLGEGRRYLG
jgi:hypothetical protein